MACNAPLLAGFSNSPDIVPISGKLLSLALGYHYLTTTTDQQVNPKNILLHEFLRLARALYVKCAFPEKVRGTLSRTPQKTLDSEARLS